MLPARNIPALVSPPCPSLPMTFPLQLQSNGPRDIISPWNVFNNTFPITDFRPPPHPFPLPVLSRLPIPLPMLRSLPFLGPFATPLRDLLTLAIAIVIVIVMARTAPSTARSCGMRPVLITIILIEYLIPIQWSEGQEVAWLLLPAAWRLNLYPVIIATIPRETLAGAFNLSRAACLRIGGNNLIPEGTGVVPPPIVHLVAGCVKPLPHIWAEGCPPLLQRWTPAPAVRQHHLDLWEWRVVTGWRKIIPWKRSQAHSSLMPRTLYIHMSPWMGSDMNPFIRSRSNDRHRFITDVGIFALAFAFPLPLRLPIGAIAASWKSI